MTRSTATTATTATTVAMVCMGILLVAATVGVQRRALAKRDESVAAALDAARRAEAAGDMDGAVVQYRLYADLAGTKGDSDILSHYARVLLARARAPRARRAEVDEAFDRTEALIRRRPDDADLRRALAAAKLARKKYAEAREHFLALRDTVSGGPDADSIDLEIARTWIGSGEHEKALALVAALTGFDRGTKSFGASAPAAPTDAYLLLQSQLRREIEDVASADVVLERCLAVHPDDPAVLVAVAEARLTGSNTGDALRAATRARELAPSDPAVLLVNGRALAANREFEAASAAYSAARQEAPDDQPLFAAAARHFMRHGNADQVLEILDAALERFPNQPVTLTFLATMPIDGRRRADFDARLTAARQRLGETNPALAVFDARMLESRGRWYEAETALIRSRSIVPDGSKGKIDELLAKCHTMLGDHDETLGDYQRLSKEKGQWSTVLSGLARAHLDLGQRAEAAAVARTLQSRWLDGGNSGAGVNLVETLSVLIPVIRAQPPLEREWGGVDRLVGRLEKSPGAPAWRKTMIAAELLAAKDDDATAALESIRDAVEAAPRHQLDPLYLSLVARVRGEDAAWSEFDRFEAPRRRRASTILSLAHAHAALARGDDRSWFERIVGLTDDLPGPEALQVLHELAGIATSAGWNEEGANCRQRAAGRMHADIRAPLGNAIVAARTGDVDAAKAAAEQVAALEGPNTPRAKVASAAALIAAARAGEPGKEIAPSMPLRLGEDTAQHLREAKKLLLEAANDRPRWHVIPALEAEVELLAGNWSEAISQMRMAIGSGDDDAWLSTLLIQALEHSHRVSEADDIRLRFAPEALGGLDRAAIDALLASGDVAAAVSRALDVVDLDHADTETLVWLGRAMAKSGRQDEARSLLDRATRAAPSSPDPWLWLARWYVEQGDRDAAEATISTAIAAVGEDERALLGARGAAVIGRDDDALRGFREAARSGGGSVVPVGHAIDFLLTRRRTQDAKAFLKDVIASAGGGQDDLVYWSRSRLADIDRGTGERAEKSR